MRIDGWSFHMLGAPSATEPKRQLFFSFFARWVGSGRRIRYMQGLMYHHTHFRAKYYFELLILLVPSKLWEHRHVPPGSFMRCTGFSRRLHAC